jgi:gas vesicle protein
MPSDPCCTSSDWSSSRSSSSSMGSSSSSSMGSSALSSGSSSSWMGFAAGLCAGAAAGAAVALAYAPMRGSDLRSKLAGYASQSGEQLSSLIESGRCLAEDALHQATALIEQGRQALSTSGISSPSSSSSSSSSVSSSSYSTSSEPLTASRSDISGRNRRFDEPLGG